MHWNYRLLRHEPDDYGDVKLEIVECYYGTDDDGNEFPTAYAEADVALFYDEGSPVPGDMRRELNHMLEACSKPVLAEADFHTDAAKAYSARMNAEIADAVRFDSIEEFMASLEEGDDS